MPAAFRDRRLLGWSGAAVTADLRKLSAGRADYYVREVARDHEEYLSGNGESPGEFLGAGSTALGKQGVCTEQEFRRLFAWRHPDTGEQLGRAPRSDAMPAWDLVLRPVKDVAILYALGDRHTSRAARDAHQAGVEAAVTYLDGQVGTRTGRDGAKHVAGSGLVAVGFTHRVSRAGDPLPHTHLVIVNRTQGPDGQWRTLDSWDLLAYRQAADAIYRATYQHELTRALGIEWGEPDRWGNRPIVGMPEELVRAFSKRHEQISAELERLEREEGKPRTAKLIQHVAHATRPAKTHDTPETLHGRWQQEAREHGHEPERLMAEVTDRAERQPAVDRLAITRAFDQLASPDGLTANASTFARREALVALGGQLAAIGPAQLEDLTERFLAERAISIMAEPAVGERRWTTPELLTVEQRLLDTAVGRAAEQVGVCSPGVVRDALAAHPSIGTDQEAMVRDLCQGGAGVQLVVGRAGTGKTYALGVARHAWQLDGYQVLGTAPTGIATVCLDSEGFEHARTVDRLLAELDQDRHPHGRRGGEEGRLLDARTVLVVDEAGMLGSRKLARLLDHAHQAGAKLVLVGDDRQLAAIEAGGGFRGLRLRLGASELTENRRQQETWEREAVEHLRNGDLDQALGAYRAHGQLVAAETPGQLKEILVGDWWEAFQRGERVAILAYRREEVDQFNTACQQLRDHAGQLGPERLQVGDRTLAVGDVVVCGKNALRSLGVANGSRGQVLALDPQQHSLTLRLDNGQEATLDGRYLDHRPTWWTRGNPGRRTIDLGYANTGHRSQGVTLDRALVRVAGVEDREWFYVAATRAAKATTFFDVVSPEPRAVELELDVPSPEPRSIDHQLAAIARRDGGKRLAVDTAAPLALRQMSKRQLRAERDRVAALLRDAPPDRTRLLAHTTQLRQQAEQGLADATAREEAARDRVAELGQGAGRLLRRRELAEARDHHTLAHTAGQLARQQADRAADRQRQARRAQQEHLAWHERHPDLLAGDRARGRELAWRGRVHQRAIELERPGWLHELGDPPATVKGQRAWRQTVGRVEQYRERYGITDSDRALGPEPGHGDLEQRRHHRAAHQAIERLHERQRTMGERRRDRHERAHPDQPRTRPSRADQPRSASADERQRGGREREAG
jgi:conjugative relaxase-like TrwC/TraI family protein